MHLADVPIDRSARLVVLAGDRAFRRRLMELGLLPGAEVRVVRRAALGGVLELEVRCCRISLRTSEAVRLEVELV
ncbi:MAG: FeoA family protein [Planctomycetota bacterium]